jgi:hypothetical protein
MMTTEWTNKEAVEFYRMVRGGKRGAPTKEVKAPHNYSKWRRRQIIAWDGEGANLDDGTHVYNLLANSEGDRIIKLEGLSTEECLNFFLRHNVHQAINVIYGGSYDVNMILRDLSLSKLIELWEQGVTSWHGYTIRYAHRKRFSAKRGSGTSFVLWDVLGFYQSSFVEACRKWLGGDASMLDSIEQMKYQRKDFSADRIDEIVEYNANECKLLILILEALFEALDECGIVLNRYDGAGSIAANLLKTNGINHYKGDIPDDVKRAAQYAYGGGRIEAPKVGNLVGPCYRYDINSAYPSAALNLDDYRGARWVVGDEIQSPNDLVEIIWEIRKKAPIYPMFFREPNGTILFPSSGAGIYYGWEVQNLIDFFPKSAYTIRKVWHAELCSEVKPFKFIERVYEQRLMFKQRGSMAAEALKLGMNSIYGKLAQQAGYKPGRPKTIPAYHHLVWAGQITSQTRARLFRAAMEAPQSVIAFATDAVFATEPLTHTEAQVGPALGQWSTDHCDGITMVQPGVYWVNKKGEWTSKYRGFDKGTLAREGIIDAWKAQTKCCNTDKLAAQPCEDCPVRYEAKLTRFITMGGAINRSDPKLWWRTWQTDKRRLDVWPGGKRLPGVDTLYHDHLCDTIPREQANPFNKLSAAFPLAWVEGEEMVRAMRSTDRREDIRTLQEDMEDSYA